MSTSIKNTFRTTNGYSLPKTVGIIYSDVKRKYFPTEEQYLTEKDAFIDAKKFEPYLAKLGIKTIFFAADSNLSTNLKRKKPDLVINLTGSVKGKEFLSSAIPGILEVLEIPYTGAGILGESIVYNKFLVKKLMVQNGIPVPNHQLFSNPNDYMRPDLRYPLISKLNEIHGAVEIDKNCISENEKHLRNRLKYLINTYKQPILVEEFIVGREITAVMVEGLNKKIYLGKAIISRKTSNYTFKSFELQWLEDGGVSYKKYKDPLLSEYVRRAFKIMDMADYGKFDIRMDSSGRYYFIDSNSNPSIIPLNPEVMDSPVNYILQMYGVDFIEFLKRLLQKTFKDWNGKK